MRLILEKNHFGAITISNIYIYINYSNKVFKEIVR
jgi:hypothetical protein